MTLASHRLKLIAALAGAVATSAAILPKHAKKSEVEARAADNVAARCDYAAEHGGKGSVGDVQVRFAKPHQECEFPKNSRTRARYAIDRAREALTQSPSPTNEVADLNLAVTLESGANVALSSAKFLDVTPISATIVQKRWVFAPVNLGAAADGFTDQLTVYFTHDTDGRITIIGRLPFKAGKKKGANSIVRPIRLSATYQGKPVTFYPEDPDQSQRSNPEIRISRGTGFRWQSRRLEPVWRRADEALKTLAILPHDETMGTDAYYPDPKGYGSYQTATPVAYVQRRPFVAPMSTQYFVADAYRGYGTPGDRGTLGWEHENAALAISKHRRGETAARDAFFAEYLSACDAIESMPAQFLWNFTNHRPLLPDDSPQGWAAPYITHENGAVANGNPNFIYMPMNNNWQYGEGFAQLDQAHSLNHAFTAYILTRDPYYLELAQMLGTYSLIHGGDDRSQYSSRYKHAGKYAADIDEERGYAWTLRNITRAARITPIDVSETRFITLAKWHQINIESAERDSRIVNTTDPWRRLWGYIDAFNIDRQPVTGQSWNVDEVSDFMHKYTVFSTTAAVLQGFDMHRPMAEFVWRGMDLRFDAGLGYLHDAQLVKINKITDDATKAQVRSADTQIPYSDGRSYRAWVEQNASTYSSTTGYVPMRLNEDGLVKISLLLGLLQLAKEADKRGVITIKRDVGAAYKEVFSKLRYPKPNATPLQLIPLPTNSPPIAKFAVYFADSPAKVSSTKKLP